MADNSTIAISRAYSGPMATTGNDHRIWSYTVPASAQYAVLRRLSAFIVPVASIATGYAAGWWLVDAGGNARRLNFLYPDTTSRYTLNQTMSVPLLPGVTLQGIVINKFATAQSIAVSAYLEQVGGTAPGLIARDTFTGTSGTALASHPADTGQAWSVNNGVIQLNGAGAIVPTVSGTFDRATLGGTTGNGYRVRATITPNAGNDTRLIAMYTDSNNLLAGGIDGVTSYQPFLNNTVAGTTYNSHDTTLACTPGTAYDVELRVITSNDAQLGVAATQYVTLLVNGQARLTQVLPSALPSGPAGVLFSPYTTGTAPQISNFRVQQL